MEKTEKKGVKSLKKFLTKAGDEIIINPEVTDDRKGLGEAKESHVVMAYGRMNPPTTGHAALVDKMHQVAKEHNAHHVLIASHSQDAKKNPLSGADKVKHLKRYFPNTNITLANKEHPTFLQHAAKLNKEGHTHLHMIAGSDRVDEYKEKLHHYNGTGEGKLFNFKHVEVHSSGERDPDAEGTAGMSASKMREHASSGNFKEFKKGVPKHVSSEHAKELYHDTRRGMKLEEAVLDYGMRRKRATNFKKRQPRLKQQKTLALKRFAGELKLKRRAQSVARSIVRRRVAGARGANYNKLSTSDKIVIDRMLKGREKQIKSLAGRLYQRVRKREVARVSQVRAGKPVRRTGGSGRILNAEFDFNLFSKMFDNLNEYQLQEKEVFALSLKAKKNDIDFDSLKETYLNAVKEYTDSDITIQQYAFNAVNKYISEQKKRKDDIGGYSPEVHQANVEKLKQHVKNIQGKKSKVVWNPDTRKYKVVFEEQELEEKQDAAASHLRAATSAQQQGKHRKADLHRKIASALKRGDKTTAQGFSQQMKSIAEEFVIDRPTGLGVMYTAGDLGIFTKGGFEHHPSVVDEIKRREALKSEEIIEDEENKDE